MATSVSKTISMPYGSASTYLTADSYARIDYSIIGIQASVILYRKGKSGYATFNSAAMNELYPTETARPYKLDHQFLGGSQPQNNSNYYIALEFDGVEVQKETNWTAIRNDDRSRTDITSAAISASTRSSTIRYHLGSGGTGLLNAVGINDSAVTLYFWQYAMTPAIGDGVNGIKSVEVTSDLPYEGDSTTFKATLKSSATWVGWYSDAACTLLVSTDMEYTVAPDADMTLYACATMPDTGTGLYVKRNGLYKEVQKSYKKISGVYVEQADISSLLSTGIKYILGG